MPNEQKQQAFPHLKWIWLHDLIKRNVKKEIFITSTTRFSPPKWFQNPKEIARLQSGLLNTTDKPIEENMDCQYQSNCSS